MKPPPNNLDKHGFPIPPKFDDYQPAQPRPARKNKHPGVRWLFFVLLLMVLGSILYKSPIGQNILGMFARTLINRAVEKYQADDLHAALADMDWAVKILPESPLLYEVRGQMRLEAKELAGSLADFDRLVELDPSSSDAYMLRSTVLQRLDRHQDAINDLNKAVKLRAARDPNPFNSRAYARALANTELPEALEDAEQAIKFAPSENEAYLDTRGYVHYLMGNYEPALSDLDRAIELGEQTKRRERTLIARQGGNESSHRVARHFRRRDEMLSVLYHHRGLIHEKLGHAALAEEDLERGQRLGYNPAEGIY
jgi:tetratricopeptide (TPR) repeat protein